MSKLPPNNPEGKAILQANANVSAHEKRDPMARLDELYRVNFKPLERAIHGAFGAGPPEPEEVVQAAFAKYAKMKNHDRIADPKAFLFMIARNIILDHKRKARRNDAYVAEQLAYDPEYELEEITPERVLIHKERFNILVATIKTLPQKQQVILIMNRIQGKSYDQIVAETGWSLGDISRNMKTAKTMLREALARDKKL